MRSYLEEFFVKLSFEEDDAQLLLTCFDNIQAHPEARKLWCDMLSLYAQDIHCDYAHILELARSAAEMVGIHCYTGNLLLFCCLSRQLKRYYAQNGFELEIFYNTLMDLQYKLDECKIVKGMCGTFVDTWFIGFFNLTRFALGRLQFEIMPLGLDYVKDGYVLTKQHKVINIHIPRTRTPIDPESCDAAFNQAKEFFAGQWSDPCTFHCSSWLLCSAHKEILPSYTNVYKFMQRFMILTETVDREGKNLWRLFDTDERNPERLPADTSLRRNYIQHLKRGKYLGSGVGIFFK